MIFDGAVGAKIFVKFCRILENLFGGLLDVGRFVKNIPRVVLDDVVRL